MTSYPFASALVTGASSGIGEVMARELASSGVPTVVVARRGDRLQSIADEFDDVEVMVADLLTMKGQRGVAARIADADRPVDLVVTRALWLRCCLLDLRCGRNIRACGRQSLGVALRALGATAAPACFGGRGGSHRAPRRAKDRFDEQVALLDAVTHANEHATDFAGRARCEARTLKRAHITEERPFRFDAARAHRADPNSRGRRPVGTALGGRLAFAAEDYG